MCVLSFSSRFVLTLFALLLCKMLRNYWNNEAHKKKIVNHFFLYFLQNWRFTSKGILQGVDSKFLNNLSKLYSISTSSLWLPWKHLPCLQHCHILMVGKKYHLTEWGTKESVSFHKSMFVCDELHYMALLRSRFFFVQTLHSVFSPSAWSMSQVSYVLQSYPVISEWGNMLEWE